MEADVKEVNAERTKQALNHNYIVNIFWGEAPTHIWFSTVLVSVQSSLHWGMTWGMSQISSKMETLAVTMIKSIFGRTQALLAPCPGELF